MIKYTFLFLSAIGFVSLQAEPTSLEMAFDKIEFNFYTKSVVNPSGDMICYTLRHHKEVKVDNGKYDPAATPSILIGSHLYIQAIGQENALAIGPEGNCWSPSWSPDGSKIAFYSDAGGNGCHVWIYEVDCGKARPISDTIVRSIFCQSIQWSEDSNQLYVHIPFENIGKGEAKNSSLAIMDLSTSKLASSGSDTPQRGYSEIAGVGLAVMNVNSGNLDPIISQYSPNAPFVGKASASGSHIAYLSFSQTPKKASGRELADLSIVNIKTKQSKNIDEALEFEFSNTQCYVWNPVKDELIYLKDGKLFLIQCNGSFQKKELLAELDGFCIAPFFFTPDGEYLVIGGSPKSTGYHSAPTTIYRIRISTEEMEKICLNDDQTFSDAKWDNYTQSLIVQSLRESGNREISQYTDFAKEPITLLRQNGRIDDLIYSHGKLLFQSESLVAPNDIYCFNLENRNLDRVTHINPKLDAILPPTAEQFETEVPFSDGTLKKVITTVILPFGAKKGDKLPGLVIFYPGANLSSSSGVFCGGDGSTIPNHLFLEKGYALILPDCPLDLSSQTPHHPVDAIVDVLLPQVYSAANRGYVNLHQLGIMGQSYGGYGTAAVISRSNLFRAAVSFSGSFDLPGSYGYMDDHSSFFGIYWSEYGQGGMGSHPWQEFLRYVRNSPYYSADNIHTPLLIMHGKSDQCCFVQEAQKLFTALLRLKKEARLLIYPGSHVLSEWPIPEAVDATSKVLEFLDEHLK